jgi:hypothetical protein
MSATVPVKKERDQDNAAARRPVMPTSVGDPGALLDAGAALQAAKSNERNATATQHLIAATYLLLH